MARKREVRFEPAVAKPGALRPAISPGDDPTDELTVTDVEYRDADFAESHVSGMSVEACLFDSVRFPSTLRHSTIAESTLRVCDLANVQADDSSLIESLIEHGRLTGLSWTAGVLRDVLIDSTRADLSSFAQSRMRTVVFRDCDLRQADFQSVEFRNVRFERCNLVGARFMRRAHPAEPPLRRLRPHRHLRHHRAARRHHQRRRPGRAGVNSGARTRHRCRVAHRCR